MTVQPVFIPKLPRYPTAFVGRRNEMAEMMGVLRDPGCRLLTLVGPGGSGKTRLALQLASELLRDFVDGVYFVPLTSVSGNTNVISSVANSVGLQFYENHALKQQMFEYLENRRMLLVLDSVEHLLNDLDFISELLEAASNIKIVVTSREPLKLQEEWVRHIWGMRFPEGKQFQHLEAYEALQLFSDRARRVQVDFSIHDALTSVIHICQLVEGMPLGIELAASWLGVLTCEDIVREIRRSTDFLATKMRDIPERHQSMRAVFDQSWRLLSDEERGVFSRLSVFRGGFARDAAERVVGTNLRTLALLADKSLLHRQPSGRYEIHELLREYAAEQLEKSSQTETLRDAFCHYYMGFLEARLSAVKGRGQLAAMKEINADFENIRVAWHYAADHRLERALRQGLETLVTFFWDRYRGRGAEFIEMLNIAQSQFREQKSNAKSLWWLLHARSVNYNELTDSQLELEACLEVAVKNEDEAEIAFCLSELGEVMCRNANYVAGARYFEQALTHYRATQDRYYIARSLFNVANWKWYLESHEQVNTAILESLALRREIGDRIGLAWSLGLLGSEAVLAGNYNKAERDFHEMNAIHREFGNTGAMAVGNAWLSVEIYLMRGELQLARSLAEAALDIPPDDNYPLAFGYAEVALSVVASLKEDYPTALHLAAKANTIDSWPDLRGLAQWALAIASCGFGDFEAARHAIYSSFQYASIIGSPAWVLWCLPIIALILDHEGEKARAVEVLALALTHPASAPGWMVEWLLLTRTRATLRTELGEEAFRAAWKAGKSLSLEETVMRLHGDVFGEIPVLHPLFPPKPVRSTVQMLADPLSDRELEVLHLINAGLSNQDIADRLFVGESTVKKHINHIFSKLNVTSRTHALARARELDLI